VMMIVVCLQSMLFCLPFGSRIVCLVLFPLDSLSTTAPFFPISESSERYYQQQNSSDDNSPTTGMSQMVGLSASDLSKLPFCSFVPDLLPAEDCLCVICLQEFQVDERVRLLRCHHCYHQKCIDEWLSKKLTCPLCCRRIQPEIELAAIQPISECESTLTSISIHGQTTSSSDCSSTEEDYSMIGCFSRDELLADDLC